MLKFFVSVLLIVKGITASDICFNRCNTSELAISQFPETNEDLRKICKPYIEYIKCEIHKEEICQWHEPEILQRGYRLISTMREVCSEDTLLHAAVVDNLDCWNGKLRVDFIRECSTSETVSDRIRQIAEGLIEKGLVSLAENAYVHLGSCLGLMEFYACQSVVIERACGAVAMVAYIEILRNVKPFGKYFSDCEETFPLLRFYIRQRKAEEEKKRSVSAIFRKRK